MRYDIAKATITGTKRGVNRAAPCMSFSAVCQVC